MMKLVNMLDLGSSAARLMGSSPITRTSSEIPTTVPFPPCGENCTLVGISSLSGRIRCARFRPDFEADIRFASFLSTQDI